MRKIVAQEKIFSTCETNCKRGMDEQYIREFKEALSGDQLSCHSFNANRMIHVLLDSCESYMIKKEDAESIIQEVQAAVSKWENLAILLQIPGREMDMFKERFKLNL